MSQNPHELAPNDPHSVTDQDLVFECPECHKSLVVDKVAAGHDLNCPVCSKPIKVPAASRVVGLSESPETKQLQAKPAWEQELISIQSALGETMNQRKEAGNQFNHRCSEANRLKVQMDKMDAKPQEADKAQRAEMDKTFKQHCADATRLKERVQKLETRLKELETRKAEIVKEHPETKA
jgi:hypothetical protein